jgi:hypothetical protein
MSEDEGQISIEKIFETIRKCRSGEASEELASTLFSAGLLRGVMHIGPAPTMRIVFASARKESWKEAERYIREKLPPQASLRYATTFGVDFIVSGQLPDTWADDHIAKNTGLFEDLYEAEVAPVKRYRWAKPAKSSNSRNKAKLTPNLTEVASFLADPKQVTHLVYDSSRLPSLSCLALITTTGGKDLEDIWGRLDDQDQLPVRDMFTNHGDKARLNATAIDRDVRASGFAFCEFDLGTPRENGTFTPAMNQAYQWRRRMVEQRNIIQVRMMPCAVIAESIDYYNELDEINDRIRPFKPTVSLPYRAREDDANEEQISFQIWNLVICGGSGSGKSVYAYVIASALLKEHKFDVVYLNYKNSDETESLSSRPRNEALEFWKIIGHTTGKGISLTKPSDIKNAIAEHPSDEPGAWYTECAKDDRVEAVLQAIVAGREKRGFSGGLFVFLDEMLNQKKNLKEDMASLLKFVNQMRTKNSFLGIIHQDLTDFWRDESARRFIDRSTVILGSSLTDQDEGCYKSLSSRAARIPLPVSPVFFDEVKNLQKREGRFVFLPNKEGNSEHPLRHRVPAYPFLKPEPMPAEWQWGFCTPPFTSC